MAFYLAVANRKGGVGKSTISVMLAHSLSVWGGRRVLIIDLDSQCNASMILLGGRGWHDARMAQKTIADFFTDLFKASKRPPQSYLMHAVGDVADDKGEPPQLSLLPGSLLLDDVQGDLFMDNATGRDLTEVFSGLRARFEEVLRSFSKEFDVVILDCAPGLSFATLAAITMADKVIVPFRPDYVSLLAIDRIALIVEGRKNLDELSKIPVDKRRYLCIANFVRTSGAERLLIEEIELSHPMLVTRMPQRDGIANAFDWLSKRHSIAQKYGDAIEDLRSLYGEVSKLIGQ